MRTKWYLMVIVLLIGVLALGACGRGSAQPTPAPAAAATEAPTEAPAAAPTVAPTEAPAAAPAAAVSETVAASEAVTATAVTTASAAVTATASTTASAAVTATAATTASAAVTATTGSTATAATTASGGPQLVIWADEQRVKALNAMAPEFEKATGVKLVLVEKAFNQIRDDFKVAGPAGQGPDLMIGAHDWLGELVKSGLVAEVNLGDKASNFEQAAVDAFKVGGKLYGMPYAMENVAFVYNPELVKEPPKTWDDVKKISKELVDGGMKYGFVIQENDPYHFYPIQTAFGGYVFGQNADGSWNPQDVGIDSTGTISAFTWLDDMYKSKLLTPGAALDGNLVTAAFANKDAAMAIMGPWTLNQLKDSGVPYAIAPIPAGSAGPGKPFLGVQGFMASSFSKQPLLAQTFLQQFVATDDTMQALYKEGGRPTAWKPVNEKIEDKDLKAFGEVGAEGIAMPNIPEMSAVWSSWGNAMALIGQQAQDPASAMKAAAEQIRKAISGQ